MKHVISFLLIFSTTFAFTQNCQPNQDTLQIGTGLHGLTAFPLPDYTLDPLWRLTQAPPDPQGWTSNVGGPAVIIPTSTSWQYAGVPSKYLNAYPTNAALTDNWAQSTTEYHYERNFCICDLPEQTDSVMVTIHLALNADNWAEVELIKASGDSSTVLSQPYVYSTSNFVGAPDSVTFTTMLSEGTHRLRIHHRNKEIVMGVNLYGWITSPYILGNNMCSETGHLAGFMFEDANNDQERGVDDPGAKGVELRLLDENMEEQAFATSDDAGYYFFMDVPAGTYYVDAKTPDTYGLVNQDDSLTMVEVSSTSITRHDVQLTPWAVGLQETDNATLAMHVYPNPSQGDLRINILGTSNDIAKVSLTDLYGRTIDVFNVTSDQHQLNFTDLARGLYIVQLEQGHQRVIEKVVVR